MEKCAERCEERNHEKTYGWQLHKRHALSGRGAGDRGSSRRGDYVAPVDVLLQMQRITKQQVEDWRFGRIDYLERVTLGGLGKMSRILRIIEIHCCKLNLTPSQTAYRKWGKGGKRIVLRFSKSGEPNLEKAYSRHYVVSQPFLADMGDPPRPE